MLINPKEQVQNIKRSFKKLKEVGCLDIDCKQCPFRELEDSCNQIIDLVTPFGEQAADNHVFDDIDLEKEVEVYLEEEEEE